MSDQHCLASSVPTAVQVFQEYAPRVYCLAYRILGNEADTEDVVADVLLQLMRGLGTFQGTAWLDSITRTAAHSLLNKVRADVVVLAESSDG